jgi:SagB-type dehydrogenase family enzyme
MKQSVIWLVCVFIIVTLALPGWSTSNRKDFLTLPQPASDGEISVERAIKERRTIRNFRPDPLSMVQLSQLLWAAQGVTDERRGFRAAPSGGALYPLDVYAVVGEGGVAGLGSGIYLYHPSSHALELIGKGDRRREVARAALSQMWLARAPLIFVITAKYERITQKYGERGVRYAHIEVGHVGQNIFLQAGALSLGAGIVGAFRDASVAEAIRAPTEHEPLIIIPVGYKKKE